jgi:hypothetical protein
MFHPSLMWSSVPHSVVNAVQSDVLGLVEDVPAAVLECLDDLLTYLLTWLGETERPQ